MDILQKLGVGALVVLAFLGQRIYYTSELARLDTEYHDYKDAQEQAVKDAKAKVTAGEQAQRERLAQIEVQRRVDDETAKQEFEHTVADLRSGNRRLSVAVASCERAAAGAGSATAAAAPTGEARAVISGTIAANLYTLADRCDDEVRDRNELIDHYAAVEALYNTLKEQLKNVNTQ